MSITDIDIAREVRRLSEETPTTVAKCVYVADDRPECIVGQAVYNLSDDKDDALVFLKWNLGSYYNMRMNLANHQAAPVYTIDAVNQWIRLVQAEQDNGANWRTAVAHADVTYPEIFRLTDPLINA